MLLQLDRTILAWTDAADVISDIALFVEDDHLDRDERLVLDLERRAERDVLDVVLQLDLVLDSMGDLVQLGPQRKHVLAFAVD